MAGRFTASTLIAAGTALGLGSPAWSDDVKTPSSYVLSPVQQEHRIIVGTAARPASIQFANVELTFPPQIGTVRLYKRIPAESNNGGWVGQVLMSVAPVNALTSPHYAYCRLSGVAAVNFSIRMGPSGKVVTTKVAVKDGFAISPPFTFGDKDPTYVDITSADVVQPPLASAIKQTWYFRDCTIGGSL